MGFYPRNAEKTAQGIVGTNKDRLQCGKTAKI